MAMKIKHIAGAALFALFLGLQGCVTSNETSENYRRLDDATIERVAVGISKLDALKILGNPWTVITYARKPNETYLNWYWTDDATQAMIFSAVIGSDNTVIRTEKWLDPNNPKNMSADTRE
jgi:outer membrane protein assembly factor BamE (lipoprotein component of BamABCDE complex)